MVITKPKLPPRAGYVEIETDGERRYKPTAETQERLQKEATQADLQNDIDAMLVDYEYRLTLLELGLFE